MVGPAAALLLTLVVHVIGLAVLVWAITGGQDEKPDWRGWWRGDEGDDPEPPAPGPAPGRDGLPLPDARQSAVRLREPGRIAGGYERPARRPERDPKRAPVRAP